MTAPSVAMQASAAGQHNGSPGPKICPREVAIIASQQIVGSPEKQSGRPVPAPREEETAPHLQHLKTSGLRSSAEPFVPGTPGSMKRAMLEWEAKADQKVTTEDWAKVRMESTAEAIQWMTRRGSFSPNSARRAANKAAIQTMQERVPIWKPSALDPEQIVSAYPLVFQAGSCPLPPGRSVWNLPKLLESHCMVCDRCRMCNETPCTAGVNPPPAPHPSCYFAKLWKIFNNGWNPAVSPEQEARLRSRSVTLETARDINHPGATAFPDSMDKTIRELIAEGKVRYIAASNFTPARVRESINFSNEHNLPSYIAVQDLYNLVDRKTYETEMAGTVAELGISNIPFYGIARGFLTGKYRPGITEVDSKRAAGAREYATDKNYAILSAMDEIAQAHGAPLGAIALGWLRAQPTVSAPIASARTVPQLEEIIQVVELTHDEVSTLNALSA